MSTCGLFWDLQMALLLQKRELIDPKNYILEIGSTVTHARLLAIFYGFFGWENFCDESNEAEDL